MIGTVILASAIQKTAANLGIGLATEKKNVLLVECDTQGSLTVSLDYSQPDELNPFAHHPSKVKDDDAVQGTMERMEHRRAGFGRRAATGDGGI